MEESECNKDTVVPPIPQISANLNLLVFISLVLALIDVFTILANITVIVALARSLHLGQNSNSINKNNNISQVLMISMAVSDAILGMTIMPLSLCYIVHNGNWELGNNIILCTVQYVLDIHLSTASVYHVACMALERYLCIRRPLVYRNLRNRTGHIMVVIIWTLPSVISGLALFRSLNTRLCFIHNSDVVLHLSLSLAFYIPFLLILVMYILILVKVRRVQLKRSSVSNRYLQSRRTQFLSVASSKSYDIDTKTRLPGAQPSLRIIKHVTSATAHGSEMPDSGSFLKQPDVPTVSHSKNGLRLIRQITKTGGTRSTSSNYNLKAIKTIGGIIVGFTVCWTPFVVYEIVSFYKNYNMPMWMSFLVVWTGYFNSALNPVLYCSNKAIKADIWNLIGPVSSSRRTSLRGHETVQNSDPPDVTVCNTISSGVAE